MAMKWWGTVNLPAVVAARCMIHAITGLARADSRLMVRLLTWRIGRRGGVGWGGSWCMHEDEIRYDDCMCNEKRDCLCRLSI